MNKENLVATIVAVLAYASLVLIGSGSSSYTQYLRELIPTQSISALAFALSWESVMPEFMAYVIAAMILIGIPVSIGLVVRKIYIRVRIKSN